MAHIEPIDLVLERAGTLLNFGGFEIFGLSKTDLNLLTGEPTIYDRFVVEVSFIVSAAACLENSIIAELPFVIEDSSYIYSFIVNCNPIPDFTGWATLYSNFTGKVAL